MTSAAKFPLPQYFWIQQNSQRHVWTLNLTHNLEAIEGIDVLLLLYTAHSHCKSTLGDLGQISLLPPPSKTLFKIKPIFTLVLLYLNIEELGSTITCWWSKRDSKVAKVQKSGQGSQFRDICHCKREVTAFHSCTTCSKAPFGFHIRCCNEHRRIGEHHNMLVE